MTLENLPKSADGLSGFGVMLGAAVLGRILYRADAHRRGLRRFFSADWLIELPTIVGMAIVGKGLAEALVSAHLIRPDGWAEAAIIVSGAYFGLRGVEAALLAWIARAGPPRSD